MIAQAAFAASVGLTVLVLAGVLFQIAIVARLTVRIAWEQGTEMWNYWRAS